MPLLLIQVSSYVSGFEVAVLFWPSLLTNSRCSPVLGLKAGKSKIKEPSSLVLGDGLLSGLPMDAFSLYPHALVSLFF